MRIAQFIRRHPLPTYFVLAFAITWAGVFWVAAPKFLQGQEIQFNDGMLMLVFMLAGPSCAGLTCAGIVDGRSGLQDLFSRMCRWRVGLRWYAASILIPPIGILTVLWTLSKLVSPAFTPGFNPALILGGLLAGFLEEIGWTGFATPRMKARYSALTAAILLGLLWGSWHVAADYLGGSRTFGVYWFLRFFSMWIVGMTATRVLMVWVYSNTGSVLVIQLMHASSTGSLLLLSPSPVSPAMETLWFAVYAAALSILAIIVVATQGRDLVREPDPARMVGSSVE